MARLGDVSNVKFTIFHAKVSDDPLIICNFLERYLKEF